VVSISGVEVAPRTWLTVIGMVDLPQAFFRRIVF
jgi:hypothetical protein